MPSPAASQVPLSLDWVASTAPERVQAGRAGCVRLVGVDASPSLLVADSDDAVGNLPGNRRDVHADAPGVGPMLSNRRLLENKRDGKWRRGELNPRPKVIRRKPLHA